MNQNITKYLVIVNMIKPFFEYTVLYFVGYCNIRNRLMCPNGLTDLTEIENKMFLG